MEARGETIALPYPRGRRWPWLPDTVRRLVREKPLGTLGGVIVLALVVVAIFANFIAPYPYDESHVRDMLKPPGRQYLLGTDNLGRDMLSRVIYGARISIYVGMGALGLTLVIATVMGLLSAYVGGAVDTVIQRVVDIWMSLPFIVVLIVIISILGTGLMNVTLVLGLMGIRDSRIVRGSVFSIKENVYIEAARAIGCSHLRMVLLHILPNIMAPIIVIASVRLGEIILAEATISFLGFGIPPPTPSWGQMLGQTGRAYFEQAPWMAIWPGLALTLVVFGFNMLGDGLRDILDPRLRGAGGQLR